LGEEGELFRGRSTRHREGDESVRTHAPYKIVKRVYCLLLWFTDDIDDDLGKRRSGKSPSVGLGTCRLGCFASYHIPFSLFLFSVLYYGYP